MTSPTVQPAASRPPRVIVYERSGRWAAALRSRLPLETPRSETRSLGECSVELALSPGSLLALEVTERNLAAVVDLLSGLNRRDPLARAIVLAGEGMIASESLLREAGAVHVVTSTRAATVLAPVFENHFRRVPSPPRSLADSVWDSLPWTDATATSTH
jgi:hypothetical protein